MNNHFFVGCGVVFALSSTSHGQISFGDTFSLGITAFDEFFTGGTFVVAPTEIAFDGVDQLIGPSGFGNSGDTLVVGEELTVLKDNQTLITLDVLAYNAAGGLTNWFADGSSTTLGDPFATVFAELGTNNGGSDKLDPTNGSSSFTLVDGSYWIVGTLGNRYGTDGTTSGDPINLGSLDSSDATGISGISNFFPGADISATELGPGEEFAGFEFLLTVSPVPEPSSFLMASFGLLGCCFRRRR